MTSSGFSAGRVIAFYGFKGGAGRSFVLAGMAAMLAAHGKSVLVVDADLEAPGLGDFFDRPSNSLRNEGGLIAHAWRTKKGYIDLLSELFSLAADDDEEKQLQALDVAIEREIDLKRSNPIDQNHPYLTQIDLPGPSLGRKTNHIGDEDTVGRILLLGPGSHNASREFGSFEYLANLSKVDVGTRVETREGSAVFSALARAFKDTLEVDYVLIDGRTGYNAASIVTIQNLATDVVLVGTGSMQSIDGIARMRALFGGPNARAPLIRPHLVSSKATGSLPHETDRPRRERAQEVKRDLVDEFHKDLNVVELPHVSDFVTGDSLLFRRDGTREEVSADDRALDRAMSAGDKLAEADMSLTWQYVQRLARFTSNLTGAFASDSASLREARDRTFRRWRSQARNSEQSSAASSAFGNVDGVVKTDSLNELETFQRLAEAYLGLVKNEPTAIKRVSSPDEGAPDVAENTSLNDLRNAFARLYLEEQAFAQVKLARSVNKAVEKSKNEKILDRARKLAGELLSPLPHLVTMPQLKMFERKEASTENESFLPVTTSKLKEPPKIKTFYDLCRDVVLIETLGREKVLEKIKEAKREADEEYLPVLEILGEAAEERGTTESDLRRFREFVVRGDKDYLPRVETARNWNVIDVVERRINTSIGAGALHVGEGHVLLREEIKRAAAQVITYFASAELSKSSDPANVGRVCTYLVDWLSIYARTIYSEPRGQVMVGKLPPFEIIEAVEGFLKRIPSGEHLDIEQRLELEVLRIANAVYRGEDERAGDIFDAAIGLVKNERGKISRISAEIQRLGDYASRLGRDVESAYLSRLLDSTSFSTDFNSGEYQSDVVLLHNTGIPLSFWVAGGHARRSKLTKRQRESLCQTTGWYGAVARIRSGRYVHGRRVIEKWEMRRDESKVDLTNLKGFAASRLWLASADARLGDARDQFKSAWALHSTYHLSPYEQTTSYINGLSEVLETLIAHGKLEEFDAFSEEMLRAIPEDLPDRFLVPKYSLDAVLLRRRACEEGPTKRISIEAHDLRKRILNENRFIVAPGDRAYCEAVGKSWYGNGTYSGADAAHAGRATRANLLLSLLELEEAPNDGIRQVERLLWTKERWAHDPFLDPLRSALALPRARLEALRQRLEIEADLKNAATEMIEQDLRLNGAGRRVFYPPLVREMTSGQTIAPQSE